MEIPFQHDYHVWRFKMNKTAIGKTGLLHHKTIIKCIQAVIAGNYFKCYRRKSTFDFEVDERTFKCTLRFYVNSLEKSEVY